MTERPRRTAPLALALALAGAPAAANTPADTPWQFAGRLGLVQYFVVPVAQAGDPQLYERAIAAACPPAGSCFLRFFTNSTGAPVAVPLPDAIASEPTAIYQRSDKQQAAALRFACRLKLPGNCF